MSNHHEHAHEVDNQDLCCAVEESSEERSVGRVLGIFTKKQWSIIALTIGLMLLSWPLDVLFFGGEMPEWLRFGIFGIAYLPVGLPVWRSAVKSIASGDIFSEFLLMGIATLGAFYIGEYAEGVAVMLFYTVGEWVQGAAVRRSRKSISDLIKSRPKTVRRRDGDEWIEVSPEEVSVGDQLLIRVGERVAFDGRFSGESQRAFDASALTGESQPRMLGPDDDVLAGMVPVGQDAVIEVTKPLEESTLSRMLRLVEQAAERKAPSERMIRKLAGYYTPFVIVAALAICLLPYFFVEAYDFDTWLYRALIFLVISCPCALVISIPLGYFGGLGAASRLGILVKGAHFLDRLATVRAVYFDKTGTLTKGELEVARVDIREGFPETLTEMAAAAESGIDHPLAQAVAALHPNAKDKHRVTHVQQFRGMGIEALVGSSRLMLGNVHFLESRGIDIPEEVLTQGTSQILLALDGWFAGTITLRDTLKPEAVEAVAALRAQGIRDIGIMSGDVESHVAAAAHELGIEQYHAGLLPEDKLNLLLEKQRLKSGSTVFVGEGFNDAPVLAAADVGIAMGQLGTEASIESADVIIHSDHLGRIPSALKIGRATKRVIWQNIIMALGFKVAIMVLGAFGLATLWQAVFADVGVALLAIANAVRLQKMRF